MQRGRGLVRAGCRVLAAPLGLVLGGLGLAVLAVPEAGAASPPVTMYVTNVASGNVTSYPGSATGDAAPSSALTTGATSYDDAFDATGDLWVTNYAGDTVEKFTAAQLAGGGSPTPAVTISNNGLSLDGPTGLAFDRSGDLWVANYLGATLVMYTPAQLSISGNPAPTVILMSAGPASINEPEAIAFDGSGKLWVCNIGSSQLSGYTPNELAMSGSPGPIAITGAGLPQPEGMAFDAAGNLWVGNLEGAVISEFASATLGVSGSPTPAVTINDDGSGSTIDAPYGMEFDTNGTLHVANTNGNNVVGYVPAQLAVSGSPVPSTKLIGGSTGLEESAGLALADAPAAPLDVNAALIGSSASVSWQAPVGPVYPTDYQVTPIVNGVALPAIDTRPAIDTHSASTSFTTPVPAGSSVSFEVAATNVFGTGPNSAPSNVLNVAGGYWEVAADGTVYPFGAAPNEGDLPAMGIKVSNIVGLVPSPDGRGYILVGSDGGIFAFGNATYEGSLPGLGIHVSDIVGVVPSPDHKGYLMVGADGGTFAFGDAVYEGSLPGLGVHVSNVVSVVPSPTGLGYLMIGSDGGTFAFGDVHYFGSLPGIGVHVSNVIGAVPSPDFQGYLMIGTDGGTFAFGDAVYEGSLPGLGVAVSNVVGVTPSATGHGYLMAGTDGGTFAFGDFVYLGSVPALGVHVNNVVAVVSW